MAFAAAALLLALPPGARADADPASDLLIYSRLFYPYFQQVPPETKRHLESQLGDAAKAGCPIRLALIATAGYLGGVTSLWGKPRVYARFLGEELGIGKRDESLVIVVMPGGFGLYAGPGVSTARERRALRGLAIGKGANGIMAAGSAAVERVSGVPAPDDGGSPWRDRAPIAAAALALLALTATAGLLLRRRG